MMRSLTHPPMMLGRSGEETTRNVPKDIKAEILTPQPPLHLSNVN